MFEDVRELICDRYTPEELIELLGVTVEEVFDRFKDEVLALDLEEILS